MTNGNLPNSLFKHHRSVLDQIEEPHTRERTPQFNESNISSSEAASTSAADLIALVEHKRKAEPAFDCECEYECEGEICCSQVSLPESSQYTERITNVAVRMITGSCLGRMVLPKRGNQTRPEHRSSRGCPSRGHASPIPLTLESLKHHDLLQLQVNAPGIGGWLEGDGPGLRLPRRHKFKWPGSRPAKRTSKPSVSSSGIQDWVMVPQPDYVAETIASVGSSFDNVVMDPSLDIKVLTL